jgi:WD40 repeat protein
VKCLAALPSGKLLSGSSDQTVRVWDHVAASEAAQLAGPSVGAWEQAATVETARLVGHQSRVWDVCAGSGSMVYSASADTTIKARRAGPWRC